MHIDTGYKFPEMSEFRDNFVEQIGAQLIVERDEEKSRSKERFFSVRDEFGQWDPKSQRPELWDLYNAEINENESMRHGLCGDLRHSDHDRSENIRRIGETAKLFFEQANIVACTFISPFRADRDFLRPILPAGSFLEVHVKYDLEVCKMRDPKGLCNKALAGEIKDFTRVSSPYEKPERPERPEIVVATDIETLDQMIEKLVAEMKDEGIVL